MGGPFSFSSCLNYPFWSIVVLWAPLGRWYFHSPASPTLFITLRFATLIVSPPSLTVASNQLGVTCLIVRGIAVSLGSPYVLIMRSCEVIVVLLYKSLPCSRSQQHDVACPSSSSGPGLDPDGGTLDLLPLEVNDAADGLKLIQVEVADLWHPWGSRAMTSSPSLNRAADQLKDDDL